MIKCALYIENGGISHLDYSCIKQANPGIGGTVYTTRKLPHIIIEKYTTIDQK